MTLSDSEARRVICSTHEISGPIGSDGLFSADSNLVVRAAAGSGKTTVLVARMTALIRSGVVPETIVAITFTRKAAGEMRGRFFSHLQDSIRSISSLLETTPADSSDARTLIEERERLRSALSVIDRIFIDTIHAFCQRILSERPFPVGLPADFSLVDPLDEEKMSATFWRRFLNGLGDVDSRRMQSIVDRGVHIPELYDYFRIRSGLHGIPVQTESSPRPDVSTARRLTEEYLDHLLGYMPESGQRDRLMLVLERADRFRQSIALDSDATIVEFLGLFDNLVSDSGSLKSDLITLNRWSPDKKSDEYRFAQALKGNSKLGESTLAQFVLEHIRPIVKSWRVYIYPEIAWFIDDAVENYYDYRVSEGRLVFRDLLQLCVDLFMRSESARVYFSSRFERILVDEFQDTDPLQAELLFLLTADDSRENTWESCRPRSGSLTIVGDDKQAIYRFRGADVRIFSICSDLIRRHGGKVLNLTSNFRSTPSLCIWINEALAGRFGPDETTYQATYEPLCAARSDTRPGISVFPLSIPKQFGHLSERIARQEAEKVVSIIKELTTVDDSRDYGDFLLLTRVANRMHVFIDALRKSGIPFETAGSRSLHRASSLEPVLHLMNVVRDPADSVSLIALLRGPLCGFSDEMLFDLRSTVGAVDLRIPLPVEVDDTLDSAVRMARSLVECSREALARWPVTQAIEHILVTTGLLGASAQGHGGSSEAGALEKLLVLLRRWESSGTNWLQARLELLRLIHGELDEEGLTLESGQGRAVRIFNIHQAKGLEAAVVFLVDADPRVTRHEAQFFVDRSNGTPEVVLPVRKRFGFKTKTIAEPVSWSAAADEEKLFSAAEDERLRYVAATRARDLLFITHYEGSSEKGFWVPFYDHLPEASVWGLREGKEAPATNRPPDPVQDEIGYKDALENLRAGTQSLNVCRVPTWELIRPSETDAESSSTEGEFEDSSRGRGRGYGRALHRLFEYAVDQQRTGGSMDDAWWCSHFVNEEVSSGEEGSGEESARKELEAGAMRALADFRNSRIWQSVCDSDECYTELPFSYGLSDTQPVQVVSGIIDLIFRVGPEWTIVDYKTDGLSESSLRKHYSGQLKAYVEGWEYLTEASSIRAGLWSVKENRFMILE